MIRARIRERRLIDPYRCIDTWREETFDDYHFTSGDLVYMYKGGYCYSAYGKEEIQFIN